MGRALPSGTGQHRQRRFKVCAQRRSVRDDGQPSSCRESDVGSITMNFDGQMKDGDNYLETILRKECGIRSEDIISTSTRRTVYPVSWRALVRR
jgi:hypothetical protein